jgi:RNA:NAD 2'-phosphotransferase (TPT1/KptA family)
MMQGNIILYHGTTRRAAEKIMKEGLRKDIGINPVVYLTSEKKMAEKYSGNGIVLKVKIPEEKIKAKIGKITPGALRHLALSENIPPHRIEKLER